MRYINFGCGLSIAPGWKNYDGSPTLWVQRLPVLGVAARAFLAPRFPSEVEYGDVVYGLPETEASIDLVYCSHVLEHLALADFRKAIREVFRVLKPGGVFRGVLPDLEAETQAYITDPSEDACSRFMESTYLGVSTRPRGLTGIFRAFLGNSQHLWMWDYKGLSNELHEAGFVNIRRANYMDSKNREFLAVEDAGRWQGCLGFESERPL